jgi:hypothetical protein
MMSYVSRDLGFMLGEMCLRKEGVRKVSTVDVTKLRVSTKIGKYMWSNVGE